MLENFLKLKTPLPKVVMVRNAESQGNLAGTITGWMDVPLSDFGRKQAFMLNEIYEDFEDQFTHVHSSDLKRSIDTSFYAMAFPSEEDKVSQSRLLRELNFGAHEGLHFDNLPNAEKERFSAPDFKADGGESWKDVTKRANEFFQICNPGETHLVFTHGGLIASYLSTQLGDIDLMPPNASLVGVLLKDDKSGMPAE